MAKVIPLYNEQATLKEAATGSQRAFTLLFNTYAGKVHALALRLTRSTELADEMVQEVFLKMWLNRGELASITVFGAYLNRVNRNCCIDVIRRLNSQAKASLEIGLNHSDLDYETERLIELRGTQDEINKAIEFLTPQQRRVYQLCHVDGLKYEEAAEKLHVSYSTIHSHMKAALKTIRIHLHDAGTFLFIYELMKDFRK